MSHMYRELPQRLPNGRLLVRALAERPNGEIGDGVIEIGPGDELYDFWDEWMTKRNQADAASGQHQEP
jgi:hypothetical protein